MIKNITIVYVLLIALVVSLLGFRGSKSRREPIYIFPDMDRQNKYYPQSESNFFENGMTDRLPPANTVARGNALDRKTVFSAEYSAEQLKDIEFLTGKDAEGNFISGFPVAVTHEMMEKGRERFDIFCSACHGYAGDGTGAIKNFTGPNLAPANLTQALFVQQPEGQIYNTIANGKNTMMSYGDKLNPEERWAVVLYVRALQMAGNATVENIPDSERKGLGL